MEGRIIEDKIKDVGEEIGKEEKRIKDSQTLINEKRKEIEELEVLEKRLQGIYKIRYKENIGDPEKIADLTNKYCLRDLLDVIAKVADTNLSYSASMIPLMTLSIWQGLYLFFGDNVGYEVGGPAKAESDKPKEKE